MNEKKLIRTKREQPVAKISDEEESKDDYLRDWDEYSTWKEKK